MSCTFLFLVNIGFILSKDAIPNFSSFTISSVSSRDTTFCFCEFFSSFLIFTIANIIKIIAKMIKKYLKKFVFIIHLYLMLLSYIIF